MRILLILGIFVASIAAVVVLSSLRPEPPNNERVSLYRPVEAWTD